MMRSPIGDLLERLVPELKAALRAQRHLIQQLHREERALCALLEKLIDCHGEHVLLADAVNVSAP